MGSDTVSTLSMLTVKTPGMSTSVFFGFSALGGGGLARWASVMALSSAGRPALVKRAEAPKLCVPSPISLTPTLNAGRDALYFPAP